MKQLTFTLYLFLSGIPAITPVLPASASADTIPPSYRILIDDAARIVPFDVSYEWREDGLLITGRIKKRRSYRGRIVGHVDIRLLKGTGEMIHAAKASIYALSPTRRNPERAKFTVTMGSVPADVEAIQVRYHTGD